MPFRLYVRSLREYTLTAFPLALAAALVAPSVGSAQVVAINEVVSRNRSSPVDRFGERPDWIELVNTGSRPIDLDGFTIGDAADGPGWRLPAFELEPGRLLVVYASGRDTILNEELHADFRVSGDGEALFLRDSAGRIADAVDVPPLDPNSAYARLPSGTGAWYVTRLTSPGLPNEANALSVSHPPGFYGESFALRVQSALGDSVRYTLDGSPPTAESRLYDGSVTIERRVGEPNVYSAIPTTAPQNQLSYIAWSDPEYEVPKVTVLRIASFRDGKRTSPIDTYSYVVGPRLPGAGLAPMISLVVDSDDLFDYERGIYTTGANFDPADPEWTGNSFMKGRAWERPAHVSFFGTDGAAGFAQDAGVRIHGQKTRQCAQKSFRLYARGEYGGDVFEHALFPSGANAEYERVVLRTSMGAWGYPTMITDALAHEIVAELDIEAQDYRPVSVYLNGEYWGVYTLTDRIDERYLAYRTDLPLDSIELWDWPALDDFRPLVHFAEENDLNVHSNYEYVASRVDIENLITYTIVQQFFANEDWPANNNAFWRPRGGKWRWILFDLDAGFRRVDYNSLERMIVDFPDDGSWSATWFYTALFSNLLDNDGFRARFIERYRELLAGPLSFEATGDALGRVVDQYEPLVPAHAERWGGPASVEEWRREVDARLMRFLSSRPCRVAAQLSEFFGDDELASACAAGGTVDQLSLTEVITSGEVRIRNDAREAIFVDQLHLVDPLGRVVDAVPNLTLQPRESIGIAPRGLAPGVYYVRASADGGTASMPFIVGARQ